VIGVRDAGGGTVVLDDLLATTRLGSGLARGGRLAADARARTLAAVAGFAAAARRAGAARVVAFATAAVREAADGAAFAQAVARETGVPVTVLDAAEEARLGFLAVAGLARGALLAVDVGGRSTELVLGADAVAEDMASLPLGALGLTEALLGDGPPSATALAAVAAEVERVLATTALPAHARARGARLVASGGTATALAALDLGLVAYDRGRVHGHALGAGGLAALARAAVGHPAAPLDPGRRRILPAGAVVLEGVTRAVGAGTIVVSDRGVRHAVLDALLGEGVP
jgi:exopolyphosphatase/guanosine-5'-triphosphate,3'-diphosphate pyrophosphatase